MAHQNNKGNMTKVQVWLVNDESSRTVHEHFGQIVEAYIPAREEFLGECKGTPRAVARLAEVDEDVAAEALANPGERVYAYDKYIGDVGTEVYLVVYPV
jgi:hypothetical protein